MPIPSFDEHGNLPADPFGQRRGHSLLHVSLQEVHDSFVDAFNDSERREEVWQGWMEHRNEFEAVGIEYATLVDGSFVTSKEEPEDVDIAILARPSEIEQINDNEEQERLRTLFTPQLSKPEYHCHAFLVPMRPFDHEGFPATVKQLTYWTRVFGIDRRGNHKSFLLVTERGTV